MARDITSGVITAIEGDLIKPLYLVKAEFDSGDVRIWSGYGSLTFNSEVYLGMGELLNVSEIKEEQSLIANNVEFSLSGIPSSLISIALAEHYQGRPISLWLGFLDSNGALVNNPYLLYSGLMDNMPIRDDGQTTTITLTSENNLVRLRKATDRFYTDEDQKSEYPDDKGFEFISTSQDVTLTWGAGL